MNSWLIIEFLLSFIDVFLVFYFTCITMNCTVKYRVNVFQILLLQAVVNKAVNIFWGLGSCKGFILMYLVTGLLFYVLFKKDIIKIYFFVFIAIIIDILIEIATINTIILFSDLSPEFIYGHSAIRISTILTSKIVYYLFIKSIVTRLHTELHFNKKMIYTFLGIFFINSMILFIPAWMYRNTTIIKGNEKIYIPMVSIGILAYNIMTIYVIKKLADYTNKELEWNLREEGYMKQALYIKNIETMNNSLKSQRHDFNNHLNSIYGLIKLKKWSNAQDYIENLVNGVEEIQDILDNANPVISSLIHLKKKQAETKDIAFDFQLDISQKTAIKDVDISVIIGNLIDNAIEACEKVSEEKKISFKAYEAKNNVILKIENSKVLSDSNVKTHKNRYTSKSDIENHGYGLGNVRHVVDKYNGFMKFDDLGDKCKVSIALPLNQDD